MILLVLLLTFVLYIFSYFLVSMIRFLLVLDNFLEDPSVNHFCDNWHSSLKITLIKQKVVKAKMIVRDFFKLNYVPIRREKLVIK